MTTRVLLVDDQPLVRLGFRAVLDSQPDIEVVGEADDGEQGAVLTELRRPDVVLMDVRMPVMDGIEGTRRIVASRSTARILVLTTFDLDEYAFAALRAGASGFLLKDATPAELLSGVRAVAAGDAVVAPRATRRMIEELADHLPAPTGGSALDERLRHLTGREREVTAELARGRSNREIGQQLHMSEATVKVHVGRILAKLGLRDRVQVVIYAYETGLVRPGQDTERWPAVPRMPKRLRR
jgi:DNA-binding NarL/FixJ family response regulator